MGRVLSQRTPVGRVVDGLRKVIEGDYNFKDSNGRLRFKGDFGDALTQAIGGRTLAQAELSQMTEAMMDLKSQRDNYINRAVQQTQAGNQETANKIIQDWNTLWPDAGITNGDIQRRKEARKKEEVKPEAERRLRGTPKAIRRSFEVPRHP